MKCSTLACFRRVDSGGECGAPRGGGGPEFTASGVPQAAFQPGDLAIPQISAPRARPSPPVCHPPETLLCVCVCGALNFQPGESYPVCVFVTGDERHRAAGRRGRRAAGAGPPPRASFPAPPEPARTRRRPAPRSRAPPLAGAAAEAAGAFTARPPSQGGGHSGGGGRGTWTWTPPGTAAPARTCPRNRRPAGGRSDLPRSTRLAGAPRPALGQGVGELAAAGPCPSPPPLPLPPSPRPPPPRRGTRATTLSGDRG